jgi:hypothetical protein
LVRCKRCADLKGEDVIAVRRIEDAVLHFRDGL